MSAPISRALVLAARPSVLVLGRVLVAACVSAPRTRVSPSRPFVRTSVRTSRCSHGRPEPESRRVCGRPVEPAAAQAGRQAGRQGHAGRQQTRRGVLVRQRAGGIQQG